MSSVKAHPERSWPKSPSGRTNEDLCPTGMDPQNGRPFRVTERDKSRMRQGRPDAASVAPRILVVNYDLDALEEVATVLSSEFGVASASSPGEAIERCRAEHFD